MKTLLEILLSFSVRKQRGAVLPLIAIMVLVFVGLAALTIDVFHLFVVRNELQNAADAGALAGARVLYNDEGTSVNAGTNQEAFNAATANKAISTAGSIGVDVNWTSGNSGDVQRGHWSFARKLFTPSDSLAPVSLWGVSTADLDNMDGVNYTAADGSNPVFINAVRVFARRSDTRAASFFARIFGYDDFALSAEAVAYRGFAGSLAPTEADQPLAICKQSIIDNAENYSCSTGRMLNSSGGTTSNTAAWTNFSQPCETATPTTMRALVCASGNPQTMIYGDGIGTVNGVQNNVYRDLRDCWMDAPLLNDARGYPRETWSLTLPVIDCPSPAISNCAEVIGAVTVDVVWIKESGADPQWLDIPVQMENWECPDWVASGRPDNTRTGLTETQRQQCWRDFASNFNLRTDDGTSAGDLTASDIQKTIVFLPSCEPHEPAGVTGGINFGVLAKIPVLVK